MRLVLSLIIKKELHTSYHCLPSASLCVRKLSHHQFNANVEFATRVTRPDRVFFWAQVKLSTIDGNNHPFLLIHRTQAGVLLGFHRIIGVSLNLIVKIDNLFKLNN